MWGEVVFFFFLIDKLINNKNELESSWDKLLNDKNEFLVF